MEWGGLRYVAAPVTRRIGWLRLTLRLPEAWTASVWLQLPN